MGDRPVTSANWQSYQITGNVAADADNIVFGGFLMGNGKVWLDHFQLFVRGSEAADWYPVTLQNPAFEEGETGEPPVGWIARTENYRFTTTDSEYYKGNHSLMIESLETTQIAQPLFDDHPQAGEIVERPLGRGLAAQIPLALYSNGGRTLNPEIVSTLPLLKSGLQKVSFDSLTAADNSFRYANILIAWNIFQHFYPYFDVVDTDWDAVLTEAFLRTANDTDQSDLLYTLRWMVAQLDDGHGCVQHILDREYAGLPFLVDAIEDKIMIVALADDEDENVCFNRGDFVISVDGVPSEKVILESKKYISGSPQWKMYRAIQEFGRGHRGAEAALVLERHGSRIQCQVARNRSGMIEEKRPAPIEKLRDGIYYVDLGRTSMEAFNAEINELADADGIIFDLRGYPNNTHGVLQHLSTDTLVSAQWQVPQQIYPDQKDLVGYDTSGRWALEPREPYLQGKIVFLTDGRAISYAESVMGIVEHYTLGEIIGQPTAGANGNANSFTLPGSYRISWTGMRVIKHNNSQHHLIGIQPTVPVERTLEGVRAGRDEFLEKALELIWESISR